jgi:hypothetical protein
MASLAQHLQGYSSSEDGSDTIRAIVRKSTTTEIPPPPTPQFFDSPSSAIQSIYEFARDELPPVDPRLIVMDPKDYTFRVVVLVAPLKPSIPP